MFNIKKHTCKFCGNSLVIDYLKVYWKIPILNIKIKKSIKLYSNFYDFVEKATTKEIRENIDNVLRQNQNNIQRPRYNVSSLDLDWMLFSACHEDNTKYIEYCKNCKYVKKYSRFNNHIWFLANDDYTLIYHTFSNSDIKKSKIEDGYITIIKNINSIPSTFVADIKNIDLDMEKFTPTNLNEKIECILVIN